MQGSDFRRQLPPVALGDVRSLGLEQGLWTLRKGRKGATRKTGSRVPRPSHLHSPLALPFGRSSVRSVLAMEKQGLRDTCPASHGRAKGHVKLRSTWSASAAHLWPTLITLHSSWTSGQQEWRVCASVQWGLYPNSLRPEGCDHQHDTGGCSRAGRSRVAHT